MGLLNLKFASSVVIVSFIHSNCSMCIPEQFGQQVLPSSCTKDTVHSSFNSQNNETIQGLSSKLLYLRQKCEAETTVSRLTLELCRFHHIQISLLPRASQCDYPGNIDSLSTMMIIPHWHLSMTTCHSQTLKKGYGRTVVFRAFF